MFLDNETCGACREGVSGRAEECGGCGLGGGCFDGRRNCAFESLPARADAANRGRSGRAGHGKLAQNVSFTVCDDDRHRFG